MKHLLILSLMLACATMHAASPEDIVPRPRSIETAKGAMRVAGVSIKCDPRMDSTGFLAVSRFAADLSLACGKTCAVSSPVGIGASVGSGEAKGLIFLIDLSLQPEEYRISVKPRHATISASSSEGIIHSLQTLKQLLPESVRAGVPDEKARWVLPCCEISDGPEFGWRGLMLDCSRHFWSTDEIKRCLDLMEAFKLNRFHWHLTDDQGWRIEIKSLPLLTQIACWREGTATSDDPASSDHVRYGGYYSQDEIREIVRYAADRGITVVPEISMPGHFLAALSAYPETGCTGGPYAAATGWGVSDQLICAGKEESYAFLESVISEVAGLFPSEYVHVGFRDCLLGEWEKCPDCQKMIGTLGLHGDGRRSAEEQLLGYFKARVSTMLAAEGKKAIFCSGTAAADDGGAATMCGNGEYTEIHEDGRLAGLQTDIWTEYISSPEALEETLLGRLGPLSEAQW